MNKVIKVSYLWALLIITLLLSSCQTYKKVTYMQDVEVNKPQEIKQEGEITIRPQDEISINVHSKDPELSAIFNLPRVYYLSGSNTIGGGSTKICSYLVDNNGEIDFPVLGKIKVEGLTRIEIADTVKKMLREQSLVKDATVTVDFMNLYVSLLGEVNHPGRYAITKDKISVLDAISMGGDLTIEGERNKVFVLRENAGKRITYQLDLRYKDKLFDSDAFYLQQNDIVYVAPNSYRAAYYNRNENYVKSISFWMSLASFLTSLGVIIF